MWRNQFFKTRIIALLVSVAVLVPVMDAFQNRNRAEAQFVDAVQAILKGLGLGMQGTQKYLDVQEKVVKPTLEQVAVRIARQFIDKNLKSVVSWAYSGFKDSGKPFFVQNIQKSFEQIEKDITMRELRTYAETTAYPYAKRVLLGLISEYTGVTTNPYKNKIDQFIKTTITEKNTWQRFLYGSGYGSYETNYQTRNRNLDGFWTKFTTLHSEGNNFLSQYVDVRNSLQKKIATEQAAYDKEITLGNGFQSDKECLRYNALQIERDRRILEGAPRVDAPEIQFEDPENTTTAAFNNLFGFSIAEAEQGYDAYFNETPTPTVNINTPTVNDDDINTNKPSVYNPAKDCAIYATTLPGAIIEHSLNSAFDTPAQQALQVDTWSELLSYTASSLADELTKQGTAKLTGWAKKEVSEQYQQLQNRVFTYEEQQAILQRAPESYDADYEYLTGGTIMSDFSDIKNDLITSECVKDLGVADRALLETASEREEADQDGILRPTEVERLIEISGLCGFGKIAKLEIQLASFDGTIDLITRTVGNLRKLDMCMPGPDIGWQTRMLTAYGRARNRLVTKLFKAKSNSDKQQNYEEYANLLDIGVTYMNENMYRYSTFPKEEYRLSSGARYRALINQSESLFGFRDAVKEQISNYLVVIQRLRELQEIWESGVDEKLNPLTPEQRLQYVNEIYSYLQKVSPENDTGIDSPYGQFRQALNFFKQVEVALDGDGSLPGCFEERAKKATLNPLASSISYYVAAKQPTVRINSDASDVAGSPEVFEAFFGAKDTGLTWDTLNSANYDLSESEVTEKGGTTVITGSFTRRATDDGSLTPRANGGDPNTSNEEEEEVSTATLAATYGPRTITVHDTDIMDANALLNGGVFTNFANEENDQEIAYFCADVFKGSYESFLLLGGEWDGERSGDYLSRVPSKIYRGFSCANFYFSRSIQDYDPSGPKSVY